MYRLILDAYCDRIMYYTNDSNQHLTTNDHVNLRDWPGPLPPNMTLRNCWDWKVLGNKMAYDPGPQKEEPKSLLEENKDAVKKLIIGRINTARAPYLPQCNGGQFVRDLKIKESKLKEGKLLNLLAEKLGKNINDLSEEILAKEKEFEDFMIITEIHRLYYLQKVNTVSTEEELNVIRDEFANIDLRKI